MLLALTLLVATPAVVDDVRPINVLIQEREPGLYQVQWQVPKALPPHAAPTPTLPESCVPEGDPVVVDRPGDRLHRQLYRCPDGLAGKTLEMRYRFVNPSLSTLVRVQLLSGEHYACMLAPTENSWRIPGRDRTGRESLRRTQAAVLAGVRHVARSPIHWVFVLASSLLGFAVAVRLLAAFAVGQLAAAPLVARLGAPIDGSPFNGYFVELALGVATALVASEVLSRRGARRQLALIVAIAGVVHGSGNALLADPHPLTGAVEWPALVLVALGMDGAQLGLALTLGLLGAIVARSRRTLAYASGAAAVALTLASLTTERTEASAQAALDADLPVAATSGAPSGSSRLAPKTSGAPLESFLAIEAFEVRHEVLIRLGAWPRLADLGLEPASFLEVDSQRRVLEQLGEQIALRTSARIDGASVTGLVERTDFLTITDQGALPRPTPVREEVDAAVVGVVVSYLVEATPETVELTWNELPPGVAGIPATVIDPETSISGLLTPDASILRWRNELSEDPVPVVHEVAVEPVRVLLPLFSAGLVLLAAALASAAWRGWRATIAWPAARVLVPLGLLVAPWGAVAIALPWRTNAAPAQGEARRILSAILPNVYRALEFRDESAAYDRLATSVSGDALAGVYLEHRQALEAEERGGARARVEAVELLSVEEVRASSEHGFEAVASWTVGGTVTHFGHRHFRQNRYDARIAVVPVDGAWKIRWIETLDQERLR